VCAARDSVEPGAGIGGTRPWGCGGSRRQSGTTFQAIDEGALEGRLWNHSGDDHLNLGRQEMTGGGPSSPTTALVAGAVVAAVRIVLSWSRRDEGKA
jgi:hypothetical protein